MNKIEKIQVLGSGCPTCKKLHESASEAAKQLNLGIEVEYVNDIEKIIELGVMSSPVMTVNGRVVISGQNPRSEEIKKILEKNNGHGCGNGGSCSCGSAS